MLYRFVPAAFLFLLSLAIQAQDTYTIKLKKEAKGSTTQESKNQSVGQTIRMIDKAGNSLKDINTFSNLVSEYTTVILEKPDAKKKATLIKRTYQKAVADVDGQKKALAYQGKTVVIQLKDDKYRFHYDGGDEITGDDAAWLDKEFNKDSTDSDFDLEAELVPTKAVAVGEAWTVPMTKIAKQLSKTGNMVLDADKAKGTGKLLKAYEKDGRQFGDLHMKLEIPVKALKEMGMDVNLQPGAVLIMEGTMSACIDGSALDGSGRINWQLTGTAIPPDNPQVRIIILIRDVLDAATVETFKK